MGGSESTGREIPKIEDATIADLQRRLNEAEETLRAIRAGEVDAVVVSGSRGDQVYTLTNADEPYRRFVEYMSEGAVTLSAEGLILYCNVRFAELLGVTVSRLMGSQIGEFVVADDRDAFRNALRDSESGPQRLEIRMQSSEKNHVPVLVSLSAAETEGLRSVCLVVTDLSEQKRNEEIVASERLARLILKQAAQAIVVLDSDGRITRASDEARILAGRPVLHQFFRDVFPLQTHFSSSSECKSFTTEELLAAARQARALRDEVVCMAREDGAELEVLLGMGPLWGPTEEFYGCVVTMTDITERQRMALAAEETAAARALAKGLMKGQEEERRRLARELHDGLNQKLAALMIRIGIMEGRVGDPLRAEVRMIQTWASEVSEEIRRVSHELHPSALENLGLVHSLEELCVEFCEQSKIETEFVHEEIPESLPLEISTCLYRVTQEALRNIAKHSGAKTALVRLSAEPGGLLLTISDHGKGFELNEGRRSGGLGLTSMEERVKMLGGSVSVESRRRSGTVIRVNLPHQAEESAWARA